MASRRERQRRRNRSKSGPGLFVLLAAGVLTAVAAIVGLSLVGYVVSIANSAPDITELKPLKQGENSFVYAKDGTRLGVIQSDILRTPVKSTDIPQVMKDATVAIEDQSFYQHKGVDFEGVIRAGIRNFESKGEKVQGGSTLTMQLIKNLYSRDKKRDYKRKIREAKLAEELENLHPGRPGKTWILTKYLNSVPYGNDRAGDELYGVEAAARVFFNKRAKDLTLPEAALMAGLPQAPSDYNPFRKKASALVRRNEVLKKMLDLGYIDAAQYADAVDSPIRLHSSDYYGARREGYFFEYVRKELVKKYGKKVVSQGGLKVYTTLDFALQKKARAAMAGRLSAPGSPESALVSIDPKTAQIRAMASSTSYGDSKYNLATQAKRQPGSTFKIIVLMTAIRKGVDINKTSYISHPLKFVDPTYGNIDVSNSDRGSGGGAKSLFQAVVTSDNTVFQQLDLDLGPPEVTKTARMMGITSKMQSLPAEALGGLADCCTPLEMSRAYVSVNDGGYRITPVAITKVVKADGTVDTSLGRANKVKIFTDGETYEAIQAMKGNVAGGTGTAAALGFCPAAGKTGTTSGFKDAWFNGMTSNLNTTVWVGYKQPKPMTAVPNYGTMFGGDAPAEIWHDFMTSAVDRKNCHDWPKPKEPFVAQPFFGKYASSRSGATNTTGTDPITPTPDPGTGVGTGGGGTAYDPGAYAAPPQPAPAA
ncbi:MAG: glycosyl transferase, partial [Solirubrobacterales bacterium]|nr:glycosyl transferase [Solirubrobacterales bacterium]